MELWDLYTKDREKTGEHMIRGDRQPPGRYRLVVHVCLFNGRGELLIQQRQPFKRGWPGRWDLSAGGSAIAGESSRRAAERELCEELGVAASFDGVDPALTVHFDYGFDDIYILTREVTVSALRLQEEEVQAAKWASLDEVLRMIDDGRFIPYHKSLIELLFFMKDSRGAHTREGCKD